MKLELMSIDFGMWLRKKRKENKLTQAELGRKIGTHENSVARWEKGDGFPTLDKAEDIVRLFGAEIMIREKGYERQYDE